MAEAIRIRARLLEGSAEVRVLMPHPMETGLRKDAAGQPMPAHYITDLQVSCAGRVVLQARMGFAVARDPMLHFRFRGARAGDRLVVSWTDNRGDSRRDETTLT